jgi:CDP-6-deoxy-D-xylo-4-hexulose-3-dehydrase
MYYELAASSWGQEELDAIQSVIESDRYTMGPQVAEFERRFADYLGKRFAVMCNSGSSANLISVASLFHKQDRPLQRGDEAIVPAVSWSTTYHPLQQYGLKMRIVDVELDTLNVDVAQLEQALGPRSRLLVAVSILGNPARLDVLREFADRHSLYFLEDNCESLDAELDGRKAGAFGDLGTHSFFYSHHISTMEGGMVVTDDQELYHLLLALRAHGWTRDLPADSPLFERRAGDHFEAYRFIVPGYNVRPTEMSGAIGLVQLDKLPAMTEVRRRNLRTFQELFQDDDRFIIQRETGKSSSFSFTLVLHPDRDIDRERVFAALKAADIGFRIITGGCILRHDVVKHYDYACVGALPNAFTVHDRGFFVGNHPSDQTAQLHRLREVLDGVC